MDLENEINLEDKRILEESDALNDLIASNGWRVLDKILKEEFERQMKQLQIIPMLPENLSKLTLAQAHVKGIQYIYDVIENYKRQREQILSDQE